MKESLDSIGLSLASFLIYLLMRFLWFTSRKEFHYLTPVEHEHVTSVCWHSELLMSPQMYRKVRPHQSASAIASRHKDGELVTRILSYLSIKPLRGSSRRGASRVLLQALRMQREGEEILLTPDGPKGPRYHLNDGILSLAMKSGLPVLIINYQAKKYWQLKSWDRFVIPKPFTKIDFYLQSVSLEGLELNEARSFLRNKMLEHALP
ncbi:MAG: lysophospholipid acyltransferase family protein [Campylobacterota bacterium]|nr:lysophospholipid acyltransferase family protein [Campylobacterota bacterium]